MGINTAGSAGLALKRQVEIFGGAQVSLDSLWRAVASPDGHDPRTWSVLAEPLLVGFATYISKLGGATRAELHASRLLWAWEDESKDPWLTGDLMSDEFIAWAYAIYLDTRRNAQPRA